MRVRISYTIDTDNIIEEVEKLINQSEARLQEQIGMLRKARDQFQEEELPRVLKQIDKTRQELSKHDQTLEDCFSILQGYNGIIEREQNGDTNEQTQSEDGCSCPHTFRGIQIQIKRHAVRFFLCYQQNNRANDWFVQKTFKQRSVHYSI